MQGGHANECGKKIFSAYISALFPSVTKVRHKTKQTTETIFNGLKLQMKSHETTDRFDFDNLKYSLPLELLTVESETKISLTCKYNDTEYEVNGCKLYK